jgi:benzil reductase ((S)-benzoin forming)
MADRDDPWDAQGRLAVITGASRGLGAGMAQAFASAGVRLALCARTEPQLPEGAEGLAGTVDVTDAGAVHTFTDRVGRELGPVDLWINNAGVLDPIAPLRAVSPDDFRQNLEVNVMGVVHGTQAYIAHLEATATGGMLVNITSGAGRKGYAGWAAYSAAKSAVDRLTEAVAAEETGRGLRAHAVAPGVVDTDMQARIRGCTEDEFPDVERFRDLKRTGAFNSPGHVARYVLALAFDPARRNEEIVLRVPDEYRAAP